MRARWWHYAAAVGMCLCGIAGFVSRGGGLAYRDPVMRSCRLYGVDNGVLFAHTHGGSAPRGWSEYLGGGPWVWWPRGGFFQFKTIDPAAYYGSEWSLRIPLWLPFLACAGVLAPRFKPWWNRRMEQLERRLELSKRLKRARLLRLGLCPTCRYDISTLRCAEGRRACPECGSPAISRSAAPRRV